MKLNMLNSFLVFITSALEFLIFWFLFCRLFFLFSSLLFIQIFSCKSLNTKYLFYKSNLVIKYLEEKSPNAEYLVEELQIDNTTKETSNIFKIMEKRLFYYIMYPSAILVWISGIYMAYVLGLYTWLVIKFLFVILLTIYHVNLGRYLNNFAKDSNTNNSKFFRYINEIPFLIMFIILIFVIIKPDIP